ncbi:actin cytoskeleton organization protein [Coniophora puteana RWD-64-598 SS2]|uniref:Actin cytoskeleton organization protein n=1 Tax=Coniophora puteana (strain RWD-64-598) TaxID=741705 RepID=A0A5M3N1I5_CONPW|nr:actin cytoskeleton organization protein [Coniophora puteana RWD-64-598 SS2]EIW85127.1 actin cytoskeleton organization protein [Coniophora puteana RWD-64-598 SS2]
MSALDRQLRPIYDALDMGSHKSAVVSCNKLIKRYPNNLLLKALKSLGLVRSQKIEEALPLLEEVLAAKTTDDATLTALMHVLRLLGRNQDIVSMFENAYKQQPQNEDLGVQTFFAYARTGNWKVAQQIATRMHKQFQEDRYLYWSVVGALLQANDLATPPEMRTLLYKLAHRQVASSPSPSYLSAERFYLHLSILQELQLYDEANKLLESEIGKSICSTSLPCNYLRRQIWRARGLYKEEAERAKDLILEKNDRNWLEFLSIIDAAFPPKESGQEPVTDAIPETRDFFNKIAETDGVKDRSGLLALIELEHRARVAGGTSDITVLKALLQKYFVLHSEKACCFEDLKPYLDLSDADRDEWTTFLDSQRSTLESATDLRCLINVHKLQRFSLPASKLTAELESGRAASYIRDYKEGLRLGLELPETELQLADDLAILAGQALVNAWYLSKEQAYLLQAVALLEFTLSKSKVAYSVRLMLIRLYRLLGAPTLALNHYRALNIKHVQNDTLSHFALSRATTFSLASTGDITYSSECLETSQVYLSNSNETSEFITRAFHGERYSQIPNFIEFEERLENSLQRDLVKMEHVRMRMIHEPIVSDLIDMEFIELKIILDRYHFDNRDFDIMPNYQPNGQPSFEVQTRLFGRNAGLGWLRVYLKMFIRAFQHASDLDDATEDKLLIGDRPKKSSDPENQLPLVERLNKRNLEEESELTEQELKLFEWALTLADWLEPYHNVARPPPTVDGQKTSNGETGSSARKDDAPPVRSTPDLVVRFFDDVQSEFEASVGRDCLPSELLHIVTIIQEAVTLLVAETVRFKSTSVVKIHKLSQLVQSLKEVRTKACVSLKETSESLVKSGENYGTADSRKAFVDACSPIIDDDLVHHDFVLNIAKNVCDSRKKTLEGVGKGGLKISSAYDKA